MAAVAAGAAGAALGTQHPGLAAVLAFVPAAALLIRRRTAYAVLFAVLGATLVAGRDFSYIHAGPIYILDATLLLVLPFAAPSAFDPRRSSALIVIVAMLGITVAHVYAAGLSQLVLRQSVLGMYALWAVVGMAITACGYTRRFSQVVFWSSIPGTLLLALLLFDPGSPLLQLVTPQLVPVAACLYIGYSMLLVLLAPRWAPRGSWVRLLFVVQMAVLIAAEVRSVWVAFPAALAATFLLCRPSVRVRWAMVSTLVWSVALLVAAALLFVPSYVGAIQAEADSIWSHSGASSSDANARWRITNWNYAEQQILAHPVTGIGFGGPEVPVNVCQAACDKIPAGDTTQVAGADLHNSILAVALRLGIPGVVVLLLFEVFVAARARRVSLRPDVLSGRGGRDLAHWLLACHVLTLVTALTAVVLEGPYMGIFFWLFGGAVLGLRVDRRPAGVLAAEARPTQLGHEVHAPVARQPAVISVHANGGAWWRVP